MSNTNVTKQVYVAIAKVAAEIAKQGISKGRKNQQQGYQFRGIDDVYNALAHTMAESNLVIIPRVQSRELREVTSKSGSILFYVVVTVEYDFVSAIDGSTHTARVVGEAMDSADKATNKAMSAAYKYLCLQTFCIPTEGDNDADGTTHSIVRDINREVKDAIAKLATCHTIEELSLFKSTLPPEVVTNTDFKAAALNIYNSVQH